MRVPCVSVVHNVLRIELHPQPHQRADGGKERIVRATDTECLAGSSCRRPLQEPTVSILVLPAISLQGYTGEQASPRFLERGWRPCGPRASKRRRRYSSCDNETGSRPSPDNTC